MYAKNIFLGFLVKVACSFKNIFQYLLLLNFCLRSSQRTNRESWIIVEIIQELAQNLKHTCQHYFSKPESDHTFLCTPPSTYFARMTLIVTLPKSPDQELQNLPFFLSLRSELCLVSLPLHLHVQGFGA